MAAEETIAGAATPGSPPLARQVGAATFASCKGRSASQPASGHGDLDVFAPAVFAQKRASGRWPRLEPLSEQATGRAAAGAPAGQSSSAAVAGQRKKCAQASQQADVAVPEDLFLALMQRGREARNRGQHVHDPQGAFDGGQRLVLREIMLTQLM